MAIKFTQVVDFTNQRLTNIGSPSVSTDAVNKSYVDSVAQGVDWKASVRAASTGNVTVATPGATIDGVSLANGERVLLKDQTTGTENGLYVFNGAASPLTRATDADTSAKVSAGMAVSISEGTVNADKVYILITDDPITLGTSSLAFTLMSGGSGTTYTAGNGLSLTGSAFAAVANTGILVTGSGIAIDPSIVVRKFASNVGDGSSTSINVNHALGTRDCHVTVYTNASPWDTVYCEVDRPDTNNVTLVFGSAPASAAYRVLVTA
jgi:phage-related tail fiber protein